METTTDAFYMCSHDLYRYLYKPKPCTVHGTQIDANKNETDKNK